MIALFVMTVVGFAVGYVVGSLVELWSQQKFIQHLKNNYIVTKGRIYTERSKH